MKQDSCGLDPVATQLLNEARDWRLLALLFERPREGWWAEVSDLARSCRDTELAAAAAAAHGAAEGEYHAIFGPGRLVSPREAGHRKTADPSKLLSEIHAYYEAFHFAPSTEETIDHVAVEAGFLGWMKLKEAYARAGGDGESAEVTEAAAQRFLLRHLATMAEPIQTGLGAAGIDYLDRAAHSLVARTGPRPKDVEGDWVPEGLAEDDSPFACGIHSAGCAARSGEALSEFEDPLDGVL